MALATALPGHSTSKPASKKGQKPNVLIILADDLGFGDISLHGGKTPTPNVDKIARQGVEFTNFMACPLSSPTRCMLLTARHPLRMNNAPMTDGTIPLDEVTIGHMFQQGGYATGLFGKWHNSESPLTPEFKAAWSAVRNDAPPVGVAVGSYGFDQTWNYYGGGPDHWSRKSKGGQISWWNGTEYRPSDQGFTEDMIAGHAIDFIRTNKEGQFLCYVACQMLHAPIQAKWEDYQKVPEELFGPKGPLTEEEFSRRTRKHYATLEDWSKDEIPSLYSAMTIAHDRNVGLILDELSRLGLDDNTIVVWLSDNGATGAGSNAPFRGNKHSLWEGGVHLPCFVRWNGKIEAGTQWKGLCGAMELMPTLGAMTGVAIPKKTKPLDGKNIWPAIKTGAASPVDSYYWALSFDDALRTDRWKAKRYCDRTELYDLNNDPGETTDVSTKYPDVLADMTAKMERWVDNMQIALSHRPVTRDVGAPMPSGDVLHIGVNTSKSTPWINDWLCVVLGKYNCAHTPQDVLVYDIMVPADATSTGYRVIPFSGRNPQKTNPGFANNIGVTRKGAVMWNGETLDGPQGVWERQAVGLSAFAPRQFDFVGLYLGNKERRAKFDLYLDNIYILHPDGKKSVVWESSSDEYNVPALHTLPEGFSDLKVEVINVKNIK